MNEAWKEIARITKSNLHFDSHGKALCEARVSDSRLTSVRHEVTCKGCRKELKVTHYKPGEIFIVKVQISIATNLKRPMCLVYDEHRIIEEQFEADDDYLEIMEGEKKRFFYAEVVPDGSGGHRLQINFNEEEGLPDWQDW